MKDESMQWLKLQYFKQLFWKSVFFFAFKLLILICYNNNSHQIVEDYLLGINFLQKKHADGLRWIPY